MSLFDQNLNCIHSKNSHLAFALKNSEKTSHISMGVSKDGSPSLRYKDIYLTSKYNPDKEASKIIKNIKNQNADYILIVGLPSDHVLHQALSSFSPNQRIIIFEPSLDILKETLCNFDLCHSLKLKNVSIFNSIKNFENHLYEVMLFGETLEFIIYPSYLKLFSTNVKMVVDIVKNITSMKTASSSTLIDYGNIFAKRNISNLFRINESLPAKILSELFPKTPAIIVSPGPSLAKNIKLLTLMKGRAIILCTAPALSALCALNIQPEFTNAIEAQNYSYLLKNFESQLDKTFLLLQSQCHPEFFNIRSLGSFCYFNPGEKSGIYFSEKFPRAFDKGIFPSGGSVATDAFFTAHIMGCDPIILIGQDLSFSGNRNYSKFTLEEDHKIIQSDKGVKTITSKIRKENIENQDISFNAGNQAAPFETKGLFKDKLLSKSDYFTFKSWFEFSARNIFGRTLINATEGGVFIEGFEHMPLSAAIKPFISNPKKDFSFIIQQKISGFQPLKCEEIEHIIKSEISVYKQLKSNAEQLVQLSKKILSKQTTHNDQDVDFLINKFQKKQESISKKLDKAKILEAYLEKALLKIEISTRQSDKALKLEDNIEFLGSLIHALNNLISHFSGALEENTDKN